MISERRSSRAGWVLAGMTAANAMILVDQTAVPLALPEIMGAFGVGSEAVQWVLNASLLPLAGLLVLGGRLGDLLGRRRMFLLGAAMFAGASVVAGLAPEYGFLVAARVVQGAGGALMLPGSVAIVSAAYPAGARGRALGTMGGVAAVAGALGPTIGGLLTSSLSWRAVFLVNVPLAVVCILVTLRAVPADPQRGERPHVDLTGSALLCLALVSGVFGLSQTQGAAFTSAGVLVPLAVGVVAAVLFVVRERRARNPLMSFGLLRRNRNYLGATVSQGLAGMAEMGLGIIFPLLLILNLRMEPVVAGLALIPTTVPMVVVSPLAGRWYDRGGGRAPLMTGFAVLAAAGIALAAGVGAETYPALLPGLLLYGVGLALVLTTNDPVSLDSIPDADHGQASGVSATAEQGGGAVGIAVLYAVFHQAYVTRLHDAVDASPLPDLTDATSAALRDALLAAEQTGLKPDHFDPSVAQYLNATQDASAFGYGLTFLVVAAIALVGFVAVAMLVRRPAEAGATSSFASNPVVPVDS
jgi:EmrB/QacA subfamily drug resistance transporter